MYNKSNDYELLYLYKDGIERALELLYEKYGYLIEIIVSSYMPYGDKRIDLVQEGRIILFECIKGYREILGVTFYSYFYISFERRIRRLLKNNYYDEINILNEFDVCNIESNSKSYLVNSLEKIVNNDLDIISIDIFNKCIIGNYSLKEFSRINNLKYENVFYKYKKLCEYLKYKIKIAELLD